MDYVQVDNDLASRNLTLLIFLPDAVKSQLVGSVERWLRDRTACAPIARRWVSYTDSALSQFYADIADKPYWPLISRFFTTGPCLATLWFGDNASQVLPANKGMTHPAQCSDATVRGRFWCDNALANLVHVSDSCDDVARELGVLRQLEPDLFDGRLPKQELAPFCDWGSPTPRHSGILTLCSRVMTLLSTQGDAFPRLDLPDGGNARETMARAVAWLEQTRRSTPAVVDAAVASYLDGSANISRFVSALRGAVPVDPWEELILTSGIQSRSQWLEGR